MQSWHSSKLFKFFKKSGLTILVLLGLFLLLVIFGGGLCVFKRLTGIPCPGCGLTRGFLAILRLDFSSAFSYNILVIPLFLCMCAAALLFFFDRKHFKAFMRIKLPVFVYAALGVLVAVSWIINIIRLR